MIIISAYACEPDKGSEPGVGWNWAWEISKNHKVLVITRKNNRTSIEAELRKSSNNNIGFIYYDPPKYLTFWKKGIRGVQLFYYIWQYGAYRKIRREVPREKIEAVFSVTFGNLWKPTFMYKLKVPFIWGPVGGGEAVPRLLWEHLSFRQRVFEFFRRLNKKLPISNPWFGTICKNADLIIVRTYDSLACIPEKHHNKCHVMIETGVGVEEVTLFDSLGIEPSESLEVTYVGRLLSLKMVDLGIRAFANVLNDVPNAKMNIVGDGEMREKLETLVDKLGIRHKVVFHGSKSREDAIQILAHSRCLLMPSCKEGGAWVLFEAMMCGRPIICMDTSGMKVVVDANVGIKVKLDNYDNMVKSFAEGLRKILLDSQLANEYGRNGRRIVRERYLWNKKGEIFEQWLKRYQ